MVDFKALRYAKLVTLASSCVACNLCSSRTQVVFGDGPIETKYMLVGRDPGENEDHYGKPFIGKAGQRLDKALVKAGINRKEIYITNLVKCHTPNNVGPTKEQITSCVKWLIKEVDIIKPEKILLFGKEVAEYMLGMKLKPFSQHAGVEVIDQNGFVMIPMYHPSYLGYNAANKELQNVFDEHIKKALTGCNEFSS